MNRTAIYFGLWAASCLLLTFVAVFGLLFLETYSLSFESAGFTAVLVATTGVIAALGWALLHRKGRRAGWLGYFALAVGVVVVTHLVVASVVMIPGSSEQTDLGVAGLLAGLVLTIAIHGWITIPVALLGTGLFVLWNRRRSRRTAATEVPSGP